MDPNQITYFAETDSRNKRIRFGIKSKDRTKHIYVIGKTGMGKSVLLENLAIQDIQNGEGLAFIDPHGGTAEKLLDYVPEHRIKDVVYFAPFDMEHPISFNVMEDIGAEKRHLVLGGLMSAFKKLFGEESFSDRMQYILQNTILALLEYPGSTMLGINRMLAEKEYRNKVIANITDPSVKNYWVKEYAGYTERFAAEAIPAIQNKIGQFTSNPLVRNIIGQPKSSFDLRKVMDEKKILIINLSKGLVGEGNANLIGSMLITKIYLAAMSRADKNESELSKLPNFYLYVDEFQSFANKSFADILSEARKYKLNLTIAHQYVEQMEEEVRNAVFGNAGTMIAFRVGAFDAEVLEREFAPVFTAEDLVNLGKYQIYLKLMIDGVASSPFSANTMPPIERPEIKFTKEVIEKSREQFTRPRSEVEKEIQDWHDEGVKKVEPKPNLNQNSNSNSNDFSQQTKAEEFNHKESNGNKKENGFALSKNGEGENNHNHQNNQEKPKLNRYGLPIIEPEHHLVKVEKNEKSEKVDPNKLAFIKASEELKNLESNKKEENKFTTLNSLKPEDKKAPSPQNLSSLKEALSSVISKTKVETREPAPAPKKQEIPESSGVKGSEKPKTEDANGSEKKPENNGSTNNKEVPEDVLRQILSMDDSGSKDK